MLWIASPALADNPIIAEDHNTEKEEADMAAVEMKDKKKEMIEKTAQEFPVSYTHLTLPTICSV